MHTDSLSRWQHAHVFDHENRRAETSTRIVLGITLVAMVGEITAGLWFNSMALLADGWHMSSHALAIGLSVMAYAFARRLAPDPRYAFGTWKMEVLGGFAGAILLLVVALLMLFGSVERLISPGPIQYREAIAVAVLGLGVNILCAVILGRANQHGHDHGNDHGHAHEHPHADHATAPTHGTGKGHGHGDLNLRSAYLHVVADAATSVLAIIALAGGMAFGWGWLDPMMGIVGAILVAIWAKGLLKQTAVVLLDREMDHPVVDEIREAIEDGAPGEHTRVTDIHVWRVGKQAFACAAAVITHDSAINGDALRQRLAVHPEVVHSTLEIHRCPAA